MSRISREILIVISYQCCSCSDLVTWPCYSTCCLCWWVGGNEVTSCSLSGNDIHCNTITDHHTWTLTRLITLCLIDHGAKNAITRGGFSSKYFVLFTGNFKQDQRVAKIMPATNNCQCWKPHHHQKSKARHGGESDDCPHSPLMSCALQTRTHQTLISWKEKQSE